MVESSVGGEQERLVLGELTGIDRINKGEAAYAQGSQNVPCVCEGTPAGEDVIDLRGDLPSIQQGCGEIRFFIDHAVGCKRLKIDQDNGLAAAVTENELSIGNRHV